MVDLGLFLGSVNLFNAELFNRVRMQPPHNACTVHSNRREPGVIIKPLNGLDSAHVFTEHIVFRLLTLVESHHVDAVTISTCKQMTAVRELYLFTTLEVDVDVWDLLQVARINIHDSHSIQETDYKVQS